MSQIGIGQVVSAGRHGAHYRQVTASTQIIEKSLMNCFLWEIALESARIASFNTKPSRLSCVFCWESVDAAIIFRNKHRATGTILGVEPMVPSAPVHRGDMSLMSRPYSIYLDQLPVIATRYWAEEGVEHPEILIGGDVRVVQIIEC